MLPLYEERLLLHIMSVRFWRILCPFLPFMSADENAKASSSLLTEEKIQTHKECIDHLIDDLLVTG